MKVVLTKVQGDIEAIVIQQLLEIHGITTWLNTYVDHSLFPLTVDGLGGVDIQVEEEDLQQAQNLLESPFEHEDNGDTEPEVDDGLG